MGPVAYLVHDAAQSFCVTGWYHRLAVFNKIGSMRPTANRRCGDGFARGRQDTVGACREILKRIVVPDSTSTRRSAHAPVAYRLRPGAASPATLGLNGGVGQAQIILNGEATRRATAW